MNDVCLSSVNAPLAPETCLTTDGTSVSNQHPAVSPDGNIVVGRSVHLQAMPATSILQTATKRGPGIRRSCWWTQAAATSLRIRMGAS